jgi:hypothetical protein
MYAHGANFCDRSSTRYAWDGDVSPPFADRDTLDEYQYDAGPTHTSRRGALQCITDRPNQPPLWTPTAQPGWI